jgi:hypothetical protein
VPPPVHDRPVADERQQASTGIRTGDPTRTSLGVFKLNRRVASAISINPAAATVHDGSSVAPSTANARHPDG